MSEISVALVIVLDTPDTEFISMVNTFDMLEKARLDGFPVKPGLIRHP